MKKKVFLFPGQGSQYVPMGKELSQSIASAGELFDQASEVLGFNMKRLCFESRADELAQTENAQPAILTLSVAYYQWLKEVYPHLKAEVMAGHSLGEISALCCSGALSFDDALRLTRRRGELMKQAVENSRGSMVAVMTREEDFLRSYVENAEGVLEISNLNAPSQWVVSGETAALERMLDDLEQRDIRCIELNVSAPFHCRLMKGAQEAFEETLAACTFRQPETLVLSNATGNAYGSAEEIPLLLARQLTHPVLWTQNMKMLRLEGILFGLEIGPSDVLKKLMRRNNPDIPVLSLDDKRDRQQLDAFIHGFYDHFLYRVLGLAVATPNLRASEAQYQTDVVKPYREIEALASKIEHEGREVREEEMHLAAQKLRDIFRAKGTSTEEQRQRFSTLFEDTGTQGIFCPEDFLHVES